MPTEMDHEKHRSLEHILQTTTGCSVDSQSPFLFNYLEVVRNPHWYSEQTDIFPEGEIKEKPTTAQLEGAKLLQESLITFAVSGPAEFAVPISPRPHLSHVNNGADGRGGASKDAPWKDRCADVTEAVKDVCDRFVKRDLLRQDAGGLQAVIDSKQFCAYVSKNEICLTRSSPALREVLWQENLSFASLWGHSKDSDNNLTMEDMKIMADRHSNVPGCLKWKLIQGEAEPRARKALEMMRGFLLFKGKAEVQSFLDLLRRGIEVSSHPTSAAPHEKTNKDAMKNRMHMLRCKEVFDAALMKKIYTNFAFRGGVLCTPKAAIKQRAGADGRHQLRLEVCMVPFSQSRFVRGVRLLLPDSYRINFSLCKDHEELRLVFLAASGTAGSVSSLRFLKEHHPMIWEEVMKRVPRAAVNHPNESDGRVAAILLTLPSSVSSVTTPSGRSKKTESAQEEAITTVPVAESPRLSDTSPQAAIVPAGDIPFSSLLSIGLARGANQQPPTVPKLELPRPKVGGHRRVALPQRAPPPAPSVKRPFHYQRLQGKSSPDPLQSDAVNSCGTPPTTTARCVPSLRPAKRHAVRPLCGVNCCFVGEFPHYSKMVTLSKEELQRLGSAFLATIHVLVASAGTDATELKILLSTLSPNKAPKIASLHWFRASRNAGRLLDINSSPLFALCPKKEASDGTEEFPKSRSLFLVASALTVCPDALLPFIRSPLRNALMSLRSFPVSHRLEQIEQKHALWLTLKNSDPSAIASGQISEEFKDCIDIVIIHPPEKPHSWESASIENSRAREETNDQLAMAEGLQRQWGADRVRVHNVPFHTFEECHAKGVLSAESENLLAIEDWPHPPIAECQGARAATGEGSNDEATEGEQPSDDEVAECAGTHQAQESLVKSGDQPRRSTRETINSKMRYSPSPLKVRVPKRPRTPQTPQSPEGEANGAEEEVRPRKRRLRQSIESKVESGIAASQIGTSKKKKPMSKVVGNKSTPPADKRPRGQQTREVASQGTPKQQTRSSARQLASFKSPRLAGAAPEIGLAYDSCTAGRTPHRPGQERTPTGGNGPALHQCFWPGCRFSARDEGSLEEHVCQRHCS